MIKFLYYLQSKLHKVYLSPAKLGLLHCQSHQIYLAPRGIPTCPENKDNYFSSFRTKDHRNADDCHSQKNYRSNKSKSLIDASMVDFPLNLSMVTK